MIKKHIPNFITCLNLMAGSMAVYYAFQSDYLTVLILVSAAAVFDFLDGFAARMLKAYSEIGKQLDSLADMVSFGLAPGALAFSLLLLLVTELPMFSLKIVKVKDKQNITQIVFLAGAAALIGAFGFDGVCLIIIWYIVMSIVKVIAKL